MATLVDTNVLIDITTRGSPWLKWTRLRLEKSWKAGSVIINQVIYSEFAIRYETMEEVDLLLPEDEFRREGLPFEAAFAAARAFAVYRRAGGPREKTLPDFLIGAHAAIRGYPILTRDPSGYARYFPGVELITPDTHP
jgi:predicted nucleic acid-binding protein